MWTKIAAIASHLHAFVRRRRLDEATRQDCETHLALLAERNIRAGMTPEEARAAAQRQFGNTTLLREEIYRMNRIGWIEALAQDLRHAVRSLRRSPAFTIAAVLTLAIGIGATTAIFSTVNATLLRPLPYPDADRIIDVHTRFVDGRYTGGGVSAVELAALRSSHLPIVRAAAVQMMPADVTLITEDGTRVNIIVHGVGEGFFQVLGLPLTLGSGFRAEDFAPSDNDDWMSLIVSYHTWRTIFSGDPAIVGKTVHLAELPVAPRIVGIAAPGVDLPHGTDFWFAARINPHDTGHGFSALLRLRPGARLDLVRRTADALMANVARTNPNDFADGRAFVMRPLVNAMVGDLRTTLFIVLGATALLLLLACANVTNLLLARGLWRTREIIVRAALGASRGRLLQYRLAEALVLSCTGTLLGLALAWAAVRFMFVLGASTLPRLASVPIDGRVLVFVLVVLAFTVLVIGLAPAWQLAGTDVRTILNGAGRTATAGRGASQSMSALIVTEIALAIVLAAGAGWLVQGFAKLGAVNPGFAAEGRLVVNINPGQRFPGVAKAEAWTRAVLDSIRAVPGVAFAGSGNTFPLRPERDTAGNVEVYGGVPQDPHHNIGVQRRTVSRDFFRAAGIKRIAGREFGIDDRQGTRPVAVVNRAFARVFSGDRNPLALQFRYGYPTINPNGPLYTVVGVVGDVQYKSLADSPKPTVYVDGAQGFPLFRQSVVVAARNGNPLALVSGIKSALATFDPRVVPSFETADAIVAATLTRQRLGMTLMLLFGVIAVALAAIGIYGVIAYASTQRRNELATRLALGASSGRVFWLVMGGGQRLTLIGVVLGLAGAYADGLAVASRVYAMRADDPLILLSAAFVVALVAGVATLVPALRASRLDPARVLRSE